ncbi:hypothetical protein [Accumulibacter sp.]|uniref:hypothetical protein n=1 Tax=Accumulibacter sp. TaxID=2053492 RepID=UPI001AD5E83A|nr:hypothetical protein [Accumulibacter sp.]MBN8452260.1 hypothetical protein [Accumulibacter sp.]
MSALTADRNTPSRDNVDFSLPVAAATKLWAGSIACLNASGFLTKGAVSTTLKAVGVVQETVDNTLGANGAVAGKVRRGCWKFGNSSAGDLIAAADWGAQCFIVDDQTVAKTNGGSTRSVAGIIRHVEADGVWVEF